MRYEFSYNCEGENTAETGSCYYDVKKGHIIMELEGIKIKINPTTVYESTDSSMNICSECVCNHNHYVCDLCIFDMMGKENLFESISKRQYKVSAKELLAENK